MKFRKMPTPITRSPLNALARVLEVGDTRSTGVKTARYPDIDMMYRDDASGYTDAGRKS